MAAVTQRTPSDHSNEKLEHEHVDPTSHSSVPKHTISGLTQHSRTLPENDGFRSAYHYSPHEEVKYTRPRGLAYITLVGLFACSQTPLYFLGGNLTFIVESIGGAGIEAWYPISYTLALAAVVPFCGYLSDIISRRNTALLGQFLNILGTALIRTTKTPGQCIAGAALAGIGAGIGEMAAQGGLGEMVPRKHRGWISGLMIIGIVPFIPYVMWSQLLQQRQPGYGWRHCFDISISYDALIAVLLLTCYWPPNEPLPEGVTRRSIVSKIDFLGGGLIIAGLTLLLMALQWGGQTYPWASATVLAPFFIGIALIIAFFVWQRYAPLPLVPLDLFKQERRVMALTFGATALAGANFFSLTNFWPLLCAAVFEPDPVKIGLRALGIAIATTVGATIWAPPLSLFPGQTRWIMLSATVMMCAFVASIACITPDREILIVVLGIFAGFGVGGCIVPFATIAIIATPDTLIGTVTALTLAIRAVGGAIGNAIYFNVFGQRFTASIPGEFVPRLLAAGLPATSLEQFIGLFFTAPTQLATVPGVTPEVIEAATIALRWVYADALRLVFEVSIVFGVLSIACALGLKPLTKFVVSNHGMDVERHLQSHGRAVYDHSHDHGVHEHGVHDHTVQKEMATVP